MMNTLLSFNKNKIKEVRSELQGSFFDVINYMSGLGWDVEFEAPAKLKFSVSNEILGFISFKRTHEWNNRPLWATQCKFGYSINSDDAQEMLRVTQRAAELCLQVSEEFGSVIPSSANYYGIIKPCPIANNRDFKDETYPQAVERIGKIRKVEIAYRPSKDCVMIRPCGAIITKEDVAVLKRSLQKILRAYSGEIAISN